MSRNIMPTSYLSCDSRNQRLKAALGFIEHPDAHWEEDEYYPNVVIRKGGVVILFTSRDTDKKGPASWSVNREALRTLRVEWENRKIDDFYFLLEEDNEFLFQVLKKAPEIATNLLRETANPSRNGRGEYYWINEFGQWVAPVRQRKKRRIKKDPDELSYK